MIEQLAAQPGVVFEAVLDIGQEPPLPESWVWSAYRKWCAAQQRSSVYERFPAVAKVECPLDSGLGARIAALKLDFVVQAGSFPLVGNIDGAARFGVWALRYGDGLPPALAELDRGDRVITVSLERLSSPRQILRQAVVNTTARSYGQTLDYAVTAGIDLPALVARIVLRDGVLPVIGTQAPPAAPPSSARVAKVMAGMGTAWAAYQVSMTIRSEMWNVGIVNAPIAAFLDGRYPAQIDWLPALGNRRFVADPFAVAVTDGLQLLLEEFDFDRYQGYITTGMWRPGAGVSQYRTVIDEGVHMSYPFPLVYEGRRYCIPESHQRREVALYRMDDTRWQKERVLIRDFAALDATVIRHDGRWWLFCTCQDDLPECKLFLWHAPDLFGPWEPHALAPVKCDVRCSRPGGTPFIHDGQLYRPTQDSSAGYGSALSINRVLRLSADAFEEETVAHIQPPANSLYRDGIHTLSAVGGMTVLDGKRMTPVTGLAMRRLLYKLKRLTGQA